MNYKLPSLLYTIRIIMFLAMLSSLLWMSSVISAVLFLVFVAFSICDFVIVNKYGKARVGGLNNLFFLILDRAIVLMPFFFACLYYSFAWWVFVILVVFEFSIHMYRIVDDNKNSNKYKNMAYYIYNLVLFTAAIMFMIQKLFVANLFVFASTIIGGVCIVVLSIAFARAEDEEQKKGLEQTKDEELIDEDVLNNDILE